MYYITNTYGEIISAAYPTRAAALADAYRGQSIIYIGAVCHA